MIICIKCGHQNPDNLKFCENCNYPLPRINRNIAPPPTQKRTRHLNMLKNAVDKLRKKEINLEEFDRILDTVYNNLLQAGENIENMEIPDELILGVQEEIEMALTGIDLFLRGVEEMKAYIEEVADAYEELKELESQNLDEYSPEDQDEILASIEELKAIIQEADDFHLPKGLEYAKEATEMLNQTLEKVKDNLRKLAEMSELEAPKA